MAPPNITRFCVKAFENVNNYTLDNRATFVDNFTLIKLPQNNNTIINFSTSNSSK